MLYIVYSYNIILSLRVVYSDIRSPGLGTVYGPSERDNLLSTLGMATWLPDWCLNSIFIITQGESPVLHPFKEPNDRKQCYDVLMTTEITFIVAK